MIALALTVWLGMKRPADLGGEEPDPLANFYILDQNDIPISDEDNVELLDEDAP